MDHPRRKKVKRLSIEEVGTYLGHLKVTTGQAKLPSEKSGQDSLRKLMASEGWNTGKLHGSIFQVGWPDLYARHPVHGERWIECKSYVKGSKLRAAQAAWAREWEQYGADLWVLRGPADYPVLFRPGNWRQFI